MVCFSGGADQLDTFVKNGTVRLAGSPALTTSSLFISSMALFTVILAYFFQFEPMSQFWQITQSFWSKNNESTRCESTYCKLLNLMKLNWKNLILSESGKCLINSLTFHSNRTFQFFVNCHCIVKIRMTLPYWIAPELTLSIEKIHVEFVVNFTSSSVFCHDSLWDLILSIS